jgi:hypothetical protein
MKDNFFLNTYFQLSKNKSLELQSGTWSHWSYFHFQLRLNRKTDHAGFYFYIEILGLYFIFQIFDHRHWDWENDCWEDSAPAKTPETHPNLFNEDGSQKFISPGISIYEKM